MPASTPPSASSSPSNEATRIAADARLARLGSQVAVVRALADQVEFLARSASGEGLRDQLIEEMVRLGCRLLETAEALTTPRPGSEESGVFTRYAPRPAPAPAPVPAPDDVRPALLPAS